MTKIEQKIGAAIVQAMDHGKNASLGNTQVFACDGEVHVFLHGIQIARIYLCDGKLYVKFTPNGWETTTTKSRFNAVINALRLNVWAVKRNGEIKLVSLDCMEGTNQLVGPDFKVCINRF